MNVGILQLSYWFHQRLHLAFFIISLLSVDLLGHITTALQQITIHHTARTCSKDHSCSGSRLQLPASSMGWSRAVISRAVYQDSKSMAQQGLCLSLNCRDASCHNLFIIIEVCSHICEIIKSLKYLKALRSFNITDI